MADRDDVDYVALVNNDAFVDPGWLGPLVDALEADEGLGAACPRILFAPRFLDLTLTSPTFRPGTGDGRELGVRLSGIEADGEDLWRDAQRVDGFWGQEHGSGEEARFEWTGERAVVRVPVPEGSGVDVGHASLAAGGRGGEDGHRRGGDGSGGGGRRTDAHLGRGDGERRAVRRDQQRRVPADRGRVRRRPGLPAAGRGPVRRAGRGVRLVWRRGAPAASLPRGGRPLRRALLPVLRGHRPGLAGPEPGLAVRVRARVPVPPHPRRQQRGGLSPLPALRRAQPPADAGEERAVRPGGRGGVAVPADHRQLRPTRCGVPDVAGPPAQHGPPAPPDEVLPGVPPPAAGDAGGPLPQPAQAGGRRRRTGRLGGAATRDRAVRRSRGRGG